MDGSEDDALWLETDEDTTDSEDPFADLDSDHEDVATDSEQTESYGYETGDAR